MKSPPIVDDDPEIPDDPEEAEPPPQAASAVDRWQQKKIKDAAKRAAAEDAACLTEILASPIGRRLLWAVIAAGGGLKERFANGPNGFPQPEATWVRAGEQSLAWRIFLSWLKLCPDGAMQMLRDNEPSLQQPPKPRRRRPEDDLWNMP